MNIPFIQAACYSQGRLSQIKYLVIHAEQGTYTGTLAWFENPASRVSAHYVLGQKGEITQMVKEQDRSWAVCRANSLAVSLEHQDNGKCMTDPNWFTPAMWAVSVQLAAQICMRHGIPVINIIGHNDPILKAYGNNHSCPGPYWDRVKYRADVQSIISHTSQHVKVMRRMTGMVQHALGRLVGRDEHDRAYD